MGELNENDEFLTLPISLLRQFCFCQRIPFFREVLNIAPVTPLWAEMGKEFHELKITAMRYRPIKKLLTDQGYKLQTKSRLVSQKLRLHGEADLLLVGSDEVIPVEIKQYKRSVHRGVRVQLVAYGLLASEQFKKKFCRAFILYEHPLRAQEILVQENDIKQVHSILSEMLMTFESQVLPHSSASVNQCTQCEFLAFCADRNY